MRNPKVTHSFEVVAELPTPLAGLQKLASNFRWTWHHETRDLFRSIDKELWDSNHHNPIAFLRSVGPERLEKLAQEQVFLSRLQSCLSDLEDYLGADTWFNSHFSESQANTKIAYFCAEFGITEGLPIYSGGLGILAGDHLKAASDLGLPLVGVGLLYARGYFRQQLTPDGWQQEIYPQYDFYEMPLSLLRNQNNEPIRIEVEFPDRTVTCQIWRADVGRIPLYLLDSNILENAPHDQTITDTLYGGDEEMRIRQEMILGIGGMRALEALSINPTVCHMNEGHAAFLSIERIRQFMKARGCDYKTARQAIVNGNVFTTHTPVPAGFDLFTKELLERYMGRSVSLAGLEFKSFLKLGRIEPENEGEAFNMAVLAMENANHVNGVSELHASVTRGMFNDRWPDYPESEVPIEAITNGVHTLTWISRRATELFDEYLGSAWRLDAGNPEVWKGVHDIPDHELWSVRENQRGDLVRFIRKRLQRDLIRQNAALPDFSVVGGVLDPRILTIGFARRFATYKRATLMLSDKQRLLELMNHAERPVQIVIAGKAHPRDDGGKKLIQELVHFINHEAGRQRMVFVEDYDMQVARALVQGVDVWLNNPRRPLEASGTSGMKIVPNGGLNCSVLDGWWDEGFDPTVGFAIGNREDYLDVSQQDWLDSRALYSLIETEIATKFYHRPDNGLPTGWIQMMKSSISKLGPRFSTARMVADYAKKFYFPSSTAFQKMTEGNLDHARDALAWRQKVVGAWGEVRVLGSQDSTATTIKLGEPVMISATVEIGSLKPEDIKVQALVGKIGPNRELVGARPYELSPVSQEGSTIKFEGEVKFEKPGHRGYTVRVVPNHPDVSIPSELNLIRWQ
jgi:starch phosphorylase